MVYSRRYAKRVLYYYIIYGRYFFSRSLLLFPFLFLVCSGRVYEYFKRFFRIFSLASVFCSTTAWVNSFAFMVIVNKLMVCILISMPIDWKLINFLIFNRKFVYFKCIHTTYRYINWHRVRVCMFFLDSSENQGIQMYFKLDRINRKMCTVQKYCSMWTELKFWMWIWQFGKIQWLFPTFCMQCRPSLKRYSQTYCNHLRRSIEII